MEPKVPQLEERGEDGSWERWRKGEAAEEARRQVMFSVPMIMTNVAYFCIQLVSVIFAGQLGDVELAGATLASSWSTVCGYTVMIGMSWALETLCGQAFGARMYRKMGIYLQASMIIALVVSAILAVIWWCTERILVALHQEPAVAHAAGVYMRPLIPALFAVGLLQCLLRFLQTQSSVMPLVICSVVPLALHVVIAYAFVYPAGMGFAGAPAAASVSFWISFLMLASYVLHSERFSETWQGFSVEAFGHVLPCLRLAIPSAAMSGLEDWAFVLLVLLAGLMPNPAMSTAIMAICVNIEALAFNVTYGFSAAVSMRVANELGAGNVAKAKNALKVTSKISVAIAMVIVLLLNFGHSAWASFFSSSPMIISEFSSMTMLLTISILLDSAQGILSGVSRGCGWQHLASWTNLGAYYIIGMPISLLLGFVLKLNVKGLWMGLICGLLCKACSLFMITVCTNWTTIDLFGDIDQPFLM